MFEIISYIFLGIGILCVVWSFYAYRNPIKTMEFAQEKYQTPKYACIFILFFALAAFLIFGALVPYGTAWCWLILFIEILGYGFVFEDINKKTKKQSTDIRRSPNRHAQETVSVSFNSPSSGEFYSLDPNYISCSCPDWIKRRAIASGPFRVCKHLASYYADNMHALPPELEEVEGFISAYGKRYSGLPRSEGMSYYGKVYNWEYLITDSSYPWVNVYVSPDWFSRYGYNREENRWAYGHLPACAKDLEKIIKEKL